MNFVKSSYCGSGSCVEVAFVTSSYCSGGQCVEVGFTTSSHCAGGECVEVGFTKSSHCDTRNCVEMGHDHTCGQVLMRDSKNPDGGVLTFEPAAMTAFLDGVKAGDFDQL